MSDPMRPPCDTVRWIGNKYPTNAREGDTVNGVKVTAASRPMTYPIEVET